MRKGKLADLGVRDFGGRGFHPPINALDPEERPLTQGLGLGIRIPPIFSDFILPVRSKEKLNRVCLLPAADSEPCAFGNKVARLV